MPADWFGEEHAPMLTQYRRHKVTSDLIAQQQEAFDPVWFADDDGHKGFGLLATATEREARCLSLMRSMQFTPQSLIRKDKLVKNQGKGLKP